MPKPSPAHVDSRAPYAMFPHQGDSIGIYPLRTTPVAEGPLAYAQMFANAKADAHGADAAPVPGSPQVRLSDILALFGPQVAAKPPARQRSK